MINQRPCVNSVLAAVLSASFLPIHGALAKEEKPAKAQTAAKHSAKKQTKPVAPNEDADKGSLDAPANGGAGDKQ